MTTPDALRAALAEALLEHAADVNAEYGFVDHCRAAECLDAILAHPAVLAALDRSDPAVGLREAVLAEALALHRNRYSGEYLYLVPDNDDFHIGNPREFAGRLIEDMDALAATPTASPTATGERDAG